MHQEIVDQLFGIYKKKGYISEDRVFDALIENNLPLDEINILCNTLLLMGVLIKEENVVDDEEEAIYHRSQTHYDQLYSEVIAIDFSVEPFIDKIREIRPPQNREWKNLILPAQEGNLYARDRIISMYLRLVVRTALWHHKKFGIILSEAIQNGCVGLIVALEKYEIGRHNNFVQHASNWIRQYIMREANPANSLMYYSAYYKNRLFGVQELYLAHDCEMCENRILCPTLLNEIAELLCCDYQEAEELLTHLIPIKSVEQLIEADERIFSDRGEVVEQMLEHYTAKELSVKVRTALHSLKPREKEIIELRFGFLGNKEKTLEEIGRKFSVTRERIRQLEIKSIRKLRRNKQLRK